MADPQVPRESRIPAGMAKPLAPDVRLERGGERTTCSSWGRTGAVVNVDAALDSVRSIERALRASARQLLTATLIPYEVDAERAVELYAKVAALEHSAAVLAAQRRLWRPFLNPVVIAMLAVFAAGCGYRFDLDRLAKASESTHAWVQDALSNSASAVGYLFLIFGNVFGFLLLALGPVFFLGVAYVVSRENSRKRIAHDEERRAVLRRKRDADEHTERLKAHARKAAETAAEVRRVFLEEMDAEQQYQADVRDVQNRPHLADPVWLEKYARKNGHQLMRDADKIRATDKRLHQSRRGRLLRERSPELLERHRWPVAAAAISERLSVEAEPPKALEKKETPEEFAARQARHEARKGNLQLERQFARLEVEQNARQRIAGAFPDLDEDEREHRVRAIVEEAYEKADGNGTTL